MASVLVTALGKEGVSGCLSPVMSKSEQSSLSQPPQATLTVKDL